MGLAPQGDGEEAWAWFPPGAGDEVWAGTLLAPEGARDEACVWPPLGAGEEEWSCPPSGGVEITTPWSLRRGMNLGPSWSRRDREMRHVLDRLLDQGRRYELSPIQELEIGGRLSPLLELEGGLGLAPSCSWQGGVYLVPSWS